MKNWSHNPKDDKESRRVALFVEKNKEETNLCTDDLVMTFLSRRVLPLQRRAHKISRMSGRMDPTRITTHSLSPPDLVLKAKQICQNTLKPSGKYGVLLYSRSNSPPRRVRSRDLRKNFLPLEEPTSYAPNRRFHDDCDADPYVKGRHKMGPTHVRHPDLRSAGANPQVVDHAAHLAAEVGQEFLDNLASRGRKNKAPAPEAGPSGAPPAKHLKKKSGDNPYGRKHRHEMSVTAGAPLTLTRSAPGIRPEAPADSARNSPPPHTSLVPSGTGKSPASPRGGNTSLGRAAPEPSNPHAEEDFISPPDIEDTGASNIGADTEDVDRAEPPVPPTPKKKKKRAAAPPTKTVSDPSARTNSSPVKETSEAPLPAKDAPSPPPAPPTGEPTPAPEPPRPEGANFTAQQLAAVVTVTTASPFGSHSLVLHASRAAVVASEKASAQLGRITELSRGEVDLGPLREYADKWNRADLSPATRGLGKDKLPVVDPSGPSSMAQHLSRLKHAVKEFDTAWHDASSNVVLFVQLPFRKPRSRTSPPRSALKAKKERLALDHRKALDAQKKVSAELKDKLIQVGLQHAQELKDAQAAGEAKLDEALKEFSDASGQLQRELEESRLLKEAQDRNTTLASD
nr:formin-like protein 8 [Lolium perenne]